MNCRELAAKIEQLQPDAMPRDVARLCLLLTNSIDDLESLDTKQSLWEAWHEMGMRLQSATDRRLSYCARSNGKLCLFACNRRCFDSSNIVQILAFFFSFAR